MRDEISMKPLDGVSVVELGRSPAARYCTRLLEMFGATVVAAAPQARAEQEDERDRAARVFLDEGKEITSLALEELVGVADVLVRDDTEPLDPLDEYATLRVVNPDVVYVYLSPFGLSAPWSAWRGTDINAQATGGLSSLIGDPADKPLTVPYDVTALGQGLHGACAVFAVLLADERDGAFVDVAGADVDASYSRMYTLLYRFYDIPPVRAGRRAPGSGGRYPMTILPCKDGDVVLIGRSKRDWERYLDMMGRPAWSEQARYRDPLGIATRYPDEVDALITPWLREHTRAELLELAHRHGVPLGAVRTLSEVLDDPQMRFREFFTNGDRDARLPGLPMLFRRPTTQETS